IRHKQPSDTIFSESRLVNAGVCVCSIMSICLLDLLVQSLKIYIADLSMKMLFGLMLKHKRPCSFSGHGATRAKINSSRALPVIAWVWLRHWLFDPSPVANCHTFSDPAPLERDVLYERPLN